MSINLDGFTMLETAADASQGPLEDGEQYEQTEYLYIKLGQGKEYDMKIEHFDDML